MDPTAQLRAAAIALVGPDPALPEDDLAPLLERLAGARLVGLGEATHGDHESFAFKQRLIQALVRRHACDIVIFERGVAEMDAYDRYVTGDIDTLPAMGDELLPWRTEEVRDLFHWLREWNQGGGQVRLAGMDMQSPAGLPLALRLLDEAGIAAPPVWRRLAAEAGERQIDLAWLESAGAAWRQTAAPPLIPSCMLHRWIALLTATFGQWLDYWPLIRRNDDGAWPVRRRAMPANALAQLERFGPEARAALWAHNGHVSLGPDSDGSSLRGSLGAAYQAVGFAFGQGMFNAGNVLVNAETGKPRRIDWTLRPHTAQPPPPEAMEYILDQLDLACYAIEPAKIQALQHELPVRSVGAALADGPVQFNDRRVPADQFDLLVYFREVTPSRLL